MTGGQQARYLWFLIAAVIVAGDRITKHAVQHGIAIYEAIPVIPGWLRLVHTENPGAAFGMLTEGNPVLRSIVLIGISSVVVIFVFYAMISGLHSGLMNAGLSLLLGGALGNLYDRVVHRTVTDFIEVYHGTWIFPAFNVADSAITVGAILLFFDLLKPTHKAEPRHAAQTH